MDFGAFFDSFAFSLGMVALFNPCGFALFPAYLGFFVGTAEEENDHVILTLNRAQLVGLSLSAGFMLVFGVIGLVFAGIMEQIAGYLPWVTLVLGVGLVVLGIAMLAGYKPMFTAPQIQGGTSGKSTLNMFLFGVSYAVISLSCTIGIFLGAIGASGTGADSTFFTRFGGFLSYGAGMGLMATAVTLAVAFGRQGVVNRLRRILPHINTISAVVLVVVGLYVAYYGYWSSDPINIPPGPVEQIELWQGQFNNAISGILGWLGVGFVVVNVAIVIAGLVIRNKQASAEFSNLGDDTAENSGFDSSQEYPAPVGSNTTGQYASDPTADQYFQTAPQQFPPPSAPPHNQNYAPPQQPGQQYPPPQQPAPQQYPEQYPPPQPPGPQDPALGQYPPPSGPSGPTNRPPGQ